MARPIAGDPPAGSPPAPFPTGSGGLPPVQAGASPFNYTNQPSLPGSAVQTTPTAMGLFNAFRRRWVLSTFIGGLVAAAVAVGAWVALPGGKHEARALVQLRPKAIEFVNRNTENFAEYRGRQVFLLKSRDLITKTLAEPAVSSLDSVKQTPDPVSIVEDQIKVTVVADDILQVTLTGNNLDDMKVVLDHLVKRYVDDATAFDRGQRTSEVTKLEQYAETLRTEIEATEKHIELLGRANNTTGSEDNSLQIGLLHRQHAEAEADYNKTTREISRLESELSVLEKQLAEKEPKAPPSPVLVDEQVRTDAGVIKAKAAWEYTKSVLEREILKAADPDANAYIKEIKGEVAKRLKEYEDARKFATAEATVRARETERAQKQAQVTALTTALDVKKLDRDKLKDLREAYKKSISAGVGGGLNMKALQDGLKPQRENLERVNAHLLQLRLAVKMEGRVSPHGVTEKIPNNNQNRKLLMSSVGGLGAFFGVVFLVSFLEWRTRRVDGVDQVVNELGMRVIGTVPAFPNRANLKAAVEAGGANWRFVLNESINSTRTMLLHTARTQSMQVVMVTSATQGEGKTSLTSQLATSMATAGMRTLIVDCDLRNPSVQKLFELPLGPGVSEVLRQEVDVSDAVQATAVPNLWVITAGQCSNATIAALAQGHPMETLFNRLRGQFDFIIVDSCPVLPVADALLIAQHVDGVVFSIMQDVSQLPKVMTATEKLNQLNIPLVGAVVNGIKQDVYSYGYNYVKQLPA
ncbi:tyrosine-protein kinase domain-containing protein [Frigoriglobus tundricola]|uniref:AAA domain-containing protein n=1 Tax=Frigoriglobus tundricola TaxID=2774151 RepID=A0A6M5YH47_9BACT|nr:CpsD/CapB family tyrosine-protein kinase [Frigoriglobus tundricola]QJW93357.1 hypothetical protein FTUN_0863 [Frigoriglobus tundricola]